MVDEVLLNKRPVKYSCLFLCSPFTFHKLPSQAILAEKCLESMAFDALDLVWSFCTQAKVYQWNVMLQSELCGTLVINACLVTILAINNS